MRILFFLLTTATLFSCSKKKEALGAGNYPSTPQYYDGKVYFQDEDKLTYVNASAALENNVYGFDISKNGEIVYSSFVRGVLKDDKQNGTLWIMKTDGTGKQQLTFNKY